jgi:hypothetical protein
MSRVFTGIALSGQLETSTKGQEAQLEAAKFGAETRLAEQRRKEKEDEARKAEIAKNTSFDPQYENAFIQNLHEQEATEKIAGIIEGLKSDDVNTKVQADNALKEFKHGMKERAIMDKQMTEMLSAAKDSSKFDVSDPHTIGGITYDNALQALEDRNNWTPDRLKEVGEKFNSSFFNLSIDETTGKPLMNFNPLGASVMDYDTEIFKGLTPEEFAIEGSPKTYKLGNTTKEVAELFPTPDAVMRSTINVAQDRRAQQTAFRRAYKEAKKQNPDMSEKMFAEQGQAQHEARIQAGERGLAPTFREEVINTELERAAENALKRVGGTREISAKEPQSKEYKPSDAEKNAKKIIADGAFNSTGDTFEIAIPGSGQKNNVINIQKGAAFRAGTEKWANTSKSADIKATPVRIEWNGPGKKSVIVYQSEFDPDGMANQEVKQTYTYRIPLTKSSLAQLAGIAETDSDLLVEEIVNRYSGGPIDQFKKWYTASGGAGSPEEIQPAGGGAASKSAYTNIKKVRDANDNVMEIGLKNGKWHNVVTGKAIN